jgi:hypothetical protein
MTTELEYNYPNELHDEDGYPTQEALDYIKNWSIDSNNGEVKMGKHFGKANYNELIDYIKLIWTYKDAIEYENGLLEIHTYGWSGNEDIIHELKNTDMWDLKFRCRQTGGHFYFKVTDESEMDWFVTKQ